MVTMLVVSHSYSCTAHITNDTIIPLTLSASHCPAGFVTILIVVHTMERIWLAVEEKAVIGVYAVRAYSEFLFNAIDRFPVAE